MKGSFLEELILNNRRPQQTIMAEPKLQGGKSYFLTSLFLYQGPIIDGKIPTKEESNETGQTTETV